MKTDQTYRCAKRNATPQEAAGSGLGKGLAQLEQVKRLIAVQLSPPTTPAWRAYVRMASFDAIPAVRRGGTSI